MKNFATLIIFLFTSFALFAQNQGHFLVELEPRSPEVEELVRSYEGMEVIPMLANNIDGQEVNIMNMRGKTVLLWFWNLDCETCIDAIPTLNTLKSEFPALEIISFSDQNAEAMRKFRESNPIDFHVIGSSRTLADGPYSADLGYPKMFFVDQNGIIKWVFPAKDFLSSKFDLYKIVKTLYMQLNQ